MTQQHLVGDISYTHDDTSCRGWYFRLTATLTPAAAKSISVRGAARLQERYGGDLDMRCSPAGVECMSMRVIAHGRESAWRHALRLSTVVFQSCGVLMGIIPT